MKLRYMLTVLYCMTGLLSASLVVGDELANTPNPASPSAGQTPRSDAPPYPAMVPRTGQTTSYAAGDDGALQVGVPWPSPRFTDNGDGTATDNLTGLIWLKNANCFGNQTWNQALADANALASGNCGLSDGSQSGDWRLPNINELRSVADYGHYGFALPTGHPFTGVQFDYYWSSSSHVGYTRYAWLLDLVYGMITGNSDCIDSLSGCLDRIYVWPVRGRQPVSSDHSILLPKTGQTISYGNDDDGALQKGVAWPSPRFTDNNNGAVTDNLTGLIWLKNANCFGEKNWTDSLAASNGLASGNCGLSDGSRSGDWRLPNPNEMMSLVDLSQCALPAGHPFTRVQSNPYWSSSTLPGSPPGTWFVYLPGGGGGAVSNTYDYYVWPVRGGQIGTSGPVIVSFSPKAGGPGTAVTITGTNFTGATAVTFGGKAAKSFTVDSSTQITAKLDDGATGAIRVKTPNGSYLSGYNFSYIPNVQITPVPPPNTIPDAGAWTATNGKQIYLQKYSDGGAICLISTDGKTIQAFYASSLTNGVFNGGDVVTGGKAQSLHIVFTAADQGQYSVTDLASGQTNENSKISLNSKAVVNSETDGLWQSKGGMTQEFYFQRYTGGGALLVMSSDAVNCQAYYDPAATANSFSGQDIYNQGTSATFSFVGTTNGLVSRTSSDGQKTTWNVSRLSAAK
ncbi:MAG: DUF1566 domain-containing protein [Deltaproteobacteria bacterium]|nr:DUF1566 domain-containing protein [Deltaproteobacteria bacterium]